MTMQAALTHQTGQQDEVLALMRERRVPLTRQNYLNLAYPDLFPLEWTAELEASLPEEIRNLETPTPHS